MTTMTTATFYIIFWFFASNWVFFVPKQLNNFYRVVLWLLTLAAVLYVGYHLDQKYISGPPHQAWQESTVYVVFFFMSLLFSTVGYLLMKSRP